MKIQFSRIITLTALTILLVVPVFVFTASYSHAAQNIVDGDLVTVSPNPDIYIVKIIGVKKFKRLILNPDIFNSYGHLKWNNVKTIDQATLDLYKLSELVIEINPDGSVADPKVYRVASSANSDVGERSWLNLTSSEFEAAGYDWDSLYKVNHKEALPSFYPTKNPLTYQDVIKIKQAPLASLSLTTVTPNKILNNIDSYLTLGGSGFKTDALVIIGSQNATVTYISDTALSVKVAPGLSAGVYSIQVVIPNGASTTLSNALTIINPPTVVISGVTSSQIAVVSQATVQIKNDKCTPSCFSTGSGVIFDSIGYILTNQHVILNDDVVEVKLNDNRVVSGTVLGWNEIYDLAVVKISAINIGVATLGDSTNVALNDPVEALGYPLPLTFPGSLTALDGKISGIDVKSMITGNYYIQSSANTQHGSSGGPLINNEGKVIGIVARCDVLSTIISDVCPAGFGLSIPINQAKSILNDLKSGVRVGSSTPVPLSTPAPQVGTLTVSKDSVSPSGNIAKDYTDQEFARFSFTAYGEAVKISSLNISTATTGNIGINSARLYINGVQISTTTDLPATGITTFIFGNSFIVPAGTTQTLVVKGEVKGADGTSFSDGNTIQVSLAAGSSNAQGQTSFTSINTPAANSNTLVVQSGALSVTLSPSLTNATASNPTAVKGATGVKIASFILSAGSGEAVTVTQIVLKNNATTGQGLGSDFQNLTLKNGATQLGTPIDSLSTVASNTYTFTPYPSISIAAGQQYVVDVYADSLTGAINTAVAYSAVILDSVTATGKSTSTDASWGSAADANGQNIWLSTGSSLAATVGSDTPIAQNRAMGQTGQTLATFKFTTGAGEGVNITKIVITDVISGNTSGAAGSIVNLKLFKNDGTQVGTTIVSMTSAGSEAIASFDGLTLSISKDQTQVLTLKGDINSYPNALSGSSHTFKINAISDVVANGASTGSSITPTVSSAIGNAQTVYRSELSVANAMSNMTGGASSQQQIGKYTFTNTSAGNYTITVSNLNLNISSTLGSGTGTMTIKRDSPSGATLATKTFSNASLASVTSWDAPFTLFTIDATNGTGSVDIYVFVDTASFTPAAAKTISTSIDAAGVTWTDGVSTGIANIDNAPVYGSTVTY